MCEGQTHFNNRCVTDSSSVPLASQAKEGEAMTARVKAMKPLGAIPKAMPLPADPVHVVRQDGLQAKGCAGLFRWSDRTIVIDAGLKLTAAHLTLEHEWVHAVLADAGVTVPNKLEEEICNALAAAIVYRKRQP
jgi:hypothetical protein